MGTGEQDFQKIKEGIMALLRTWPHIVVSTGVLVGGWHVLGEEKLLEKIDERIDIKLEPVIDVVDSNHYVSQETNAMIREFLKAQEKEELIEKAEATVQQQKAMDATRKKLGRHRYKKEKKN